MSEKAAATAAPAPGITRVPLKHPVTFDGIKTGYLDIRRPKVRDQLHAEKVSGSDPEKEVNLFASLAGVAPALIEDLDLADYVALQEAFKGFLPQRQPASGTPA